MKSGLVLCWYHNRSLYHLQQGDWGRVFKALHEHFTSTTCLYAW